jgi:hypothetical protein
MKFKMRFGGAAMALGLGVLGAAGLAQAATITFETAPFGADFTGPVTENGFTYATDSGFLYVDQYGNPGQDMEGQVAGGGGVLDIVSASAGDFKFSGLDYAAYDSSDSGSQTLSITGYLSGSPVGTESYTLANTNVFNPTYANWTTENASGLAGVTIDDLKITLNAGGGETASFLQGIDNVNLNVAGAVPEPASWAMVLIGFFGLGATLRSRRRMTPAAI